MVGGSGMARKKSESVLLCFQCFENFFYIRFVGERSLEVVSLVYHDPRNSADVVLH